MAAKTMTAKTKATMGAVMALACVAMAARAAPPPAHDAAAQAATRPQAAQTAPVAPAASAAPAYDAALAARVGADAHGMRKYVLVILKTGPERMPDGEARKAMFAGHFANMERLAKAGKLALAGPFAQDPDGWRGLFVLAVADLDEARALVATDPAVAAGEFVAEYHRWYGSAATMLVPELHEKLQAPSPDTPAK